MKMNNTINENNTIATGTIDIMDKGISCLIASLGVLDTERFISFIIREKFDYTKWQRNYFDNEENFAENALKYAKENPVKFARINE